ncbi:sulfur carrier protein ThiS [Cyanobacterium sp. IPPAS B-1200]|uniref:sulfur carrier protein ThiS n=1 Tax=Cyanobacterium sp. IPPAS B-1200 TaxID=1562720 RepID=UPI000852800E|nr:sulfur carrier protein ThiS [Cyanobacterium sp. IPPAS B-1200]OEJ78965.1 thiamine biosynthesis protein ThiS [Cyanobacterium sp. IPPAS B-1200]
MEEEKINITVNGETHQFETNLLLLQLLEILKFNPRLIALEYNGEILHRQYWDSTMVQDGDRLEVVTIVGGG